MRRYETCQSQALLSIFNHFNPSGQALDVGRKQVRSKEGNTESDQKLQVAEQKMGELLSAMGVLGTEAAAAMTSVEAQQQRLTLQRLVSMVSFMFFCSWLWKQSYIIDSSFMYAIAMRITTWEDNLTNITVSKARGEVFKSSAIISSMFICRACWNTLRMCLKLGTEAMPLPEQYEYTS